MTITKAVVGCVILVGMVVIGMAAAVILITEIAEMFHKKQEEEDKW